MKTFATFLATTIAIVLAGAPAVAQQKLILKASDVHPAGYPTVVAVEDLGKKLEKATNGRVSIAMYPSMQLGGEKEAIEQAQDSIHRTLLTEGSTRVGHRYRFHWLCWCPRRGRARRCRYGNRLR